MVDRAYKLRMVIDRISSMLADQYTISDREMCDKIALVCQEAINDDKQKCIICNQLTTGSVGAAGLHWPTLCQPCKDGEDKALSDQLKIQSQMFGLALDNLFKR